MSLAYYNEHEPYAVEALRPWSRDLAGERFGSLTVLSFAGYAGSPTRHGHWRCRCECGDDRIVRATRLVRGRAVSCATCSRRNGAIRAASANKLPRDLTTLRKSIGHYRQNAKRRGLAFDLSEDAVRCLLAAPCWYCGATASPQNGIDRVVNSGGYTIPNVVSCCATCNYAKRGMSAAEFLGWVARVHSHGSARK